MTLTFFISISFVHNFYNSSMQFRCCLASVTRNFLFTYGILLYKLCDHLVGFIVIRVILELFWSFNFFLWGSVACTRRNACTRHETICWLTHTQRRLDAAPVYSTLHTLLLMRFSTRNHDRTRAAAGRKLFIALKQFCSDLKTSFF